MRVTLALGCAVLLAAAGPARAVSPLAVPGTVANPTAAQATTLPVFPEGPAPPLSGVLDPDAYRLGPGDLLVLNIWGPLSQTIGLEVGPDGEIFVPDQGPLFVSDLTLADVRRRIQELVRARYRGVRVDVRLQRVRSFFVYLTGELRHPGPVLAQGSSRIVDLLPDSVLTQRSSRRNIMVRHRDGTSYVYDLQLFLLAGDAQPSEALGGGDVIYVPNALEYVGVWGGVARPGRYELGPRDSLLTLLRIAGGLTPAAYRDSALFVRWSEASGLESSWVSVPAMLNGDLNIPIRNGDNLYIAFDPEFHDLHQVAVTGQVRRAGDIPILIGRSRLSDAIRAAGGFRPDADLYAIRLLRVRPEQASRTVEFERLARLGRSEMTAGEYEAFRTQLAALNPDFRIEWARIEGGGSDLDPLLEDGDIIRVDRFHNAIRVDGQVANPGVFEFDSTSTYRRFIQLAGGFTDRAARGRVLITRAVNGQTAPARAVDRLAPGDLVWVPERPDISLWERLKELIIVGGGVATIVLAARRI